jgi:hypothetical protein
MKISDLATYIVADGNVSNFICPILSARGSHYLVS